MPRSLIIFLFAFALHATAEVPTEAVHLKEGVDRFDHFQELPINQITPQGWLREFLHRQVTGLTGHHEVLSYPYDTCLWAGEIPRKGKQGQDWWRYEQTAYLTDGAIRLGYLLDQKDLIHLGSSSVEYVMQHKMANGRLGHIFFESQWPMAVFFRAIQAEFSATQDPALLAALDTHYNSYTVSDLVNGHHRNLVNIEGMLWTYGMTGDRRLLEKAKQIYLESLKNPSFAMIFSTSFVTVHGVSYMEKAKLPAILYIYTGEKRFLDAALNAFRKLDRDHMLPDGVPSSNEYLVGRNPLLSHETCDISDYTWSLGYLLMATGDATWADHIEKAIFNAGPGAVSKDFRNFQYFSSVNQVIATGTSNHNKGSVPEAYGSTWMAYWPCNEVECCAGNVHRFMPNYAARMWLRDSRRGLVAALYGPSSISFTPAGDQDSVTVTEETRYPFSDTINFKWGMKRPTAIPFTFRIPGWCEDASVELNGVPVAQPLKPGTFATIDRTFSDGDEIVVRLPMKAKLVQQDHWGVFVERGPILYALPVPEKVTVDEKIYPNLHGKKSSDPVNFPALDIRPAGPWNYALAATSSSDLQINATSNSLYPFDPGNVGTSIRVPVRLIPTWKLAEDRFTPALPTEGTYSCDSSVTYVNLVPYGSTRLRVSVFPKAN